MDVGWVKKFFDDGMGSDRIFGTSLMTREMKLCSNKITLHSSYHSLS
jgi:hypothetical protein